MLRTLLRSHHSHPRAPFAHTPLPRATHPSEMIRCTDEGYRIEDSAWSEISDKVGNRRQCERARQCRNPPRPHDSTPFQPRRVRASAHHRSVLLRSACVACRVRVSRARRGTPLLKSAPHRMPLLSTLHALLRLALPPHSLPLSLSLSLTSASVKGWGRSPR